MSPQLALCAAQKNNKLSNNMEIFISLLIKQQYQRQTPCHQSLSNSSQGLGLVSAVFCCQMGFLLTERSLACGTRVTLIIPVLV